MFGKNVVWNKNFRKKKIIGKNVFGKKIFGKNGLEEMSDHLISIRIFEKNIIKLDDKTVNKYV